MIEELQKLGLSSIEARVYIALIELGPSFAGAIISKTKQHRQQVYTALERLEKNGLISISRKNGKKMFRPTNPERLYEIVRAQESVAQEIVPELQKKFSLPKEEVVLYHGPDGYKVSLQNRIALAKKGMVIRVIGGTGEEFYQLTKDFFNEYITELHKRGSNIHWIIYESQLEKFKEHFGTYLTRECRARLIHNAQQTPVATIIFGDRVQISLFHPNPTIIEIRNQSLADAYGTYFTYLWDHGEEIK